MSSDATERAVRGTRYALVGLTGAVAAVSLVGWLLGILVLASVSPAYVPMAPVSAAVFLALCAAVIVRTRVGRRRSRAFVLGICIAVAAVMTLELADATLGLPVALDRVIVPNPGLVDGVQTGRMSPVTAVAFALLSVALILLGSDVPSRIRSGTILSVVVASGAGVLLVGYTFGAPLLYGAGLVPVALPTAVGLAFLSVAISTLAGRDRWPLGLFVGDSVRSQLMRSMLPVVAVTTTVIAALIEVYHRLGLAQNPVAIATVFILALTVVGVTVFRVAARVGRRLDEASARQEAAERERDAYQMHLETLVASRTEELESANEQLAATNEQLAAANQELVSVNDELSLATRAKSEFLANMSHELRTPLNSIIGFTGVLTQGLAGDLNPEQQAQLRMVRHSGERLLALINDILDLSRVEAGSVAVEPADVAARDVVVAASGTILPLARQAGLEFIVENVPAHITLRTDPQKLDQILVNLLANAVKFTDEGHVSLRVLVPNDDEIVFEVADTGVGIAPEDMEAIFDEFVQRTHGDGKPEGTGLGLAISRRLVALLGGELTATSVVGEGSRFLVRLPRVYRPRE